MANSAVYPEPVIATTGVIVSVQGANPGPPSGITYTVEVNVPGVGVQQFAGVAPDVGRYPDEIDVRAQEPGTACFVFIMPNGVMQFDIREIAHFGPCE